MEPKSRSLLSNEKECYVCRRTLGLERHHIYGGRANRPKSEEDGCWIYLCVEHHKGNRGVHQNPNKGIDLDIKQRCQKKWENAFGDREVFIERYGRSWL